VPVAKHLLAIGISEKIGGPHEVSRGVYWAFDPPFSWNCWANMISLYKILKTIVYIKYNKSLYLIEIKFKLQSNKKGKK
jgi:hypothetical protein